MFNIKNNCKDLDWPSSRLISTYKPISNFKFLSLSSFLQFSSSSFKNFGWSFKKLNFFIIFYIIICQHAINCSWQESIDPKIIVPQLRDSEVQKFNGNSTYYRLLEKHNDYMLVGSRNIIFNISLSTLEENNRLEWFSKEDDVRMCLLKGKSATQCQNYIRIVATMKNGKLFVCGTNAFKPICRHYTVDSNKDLAISIEEPGQGICPYDPDHQSVAIYAEENLYVATVAQFSGADPLIYRLPLRSEQFNPKHLNAPSFVNALHHNHQVFFLFKESAIEEINCGKKIVSRIAHVCTNDKGGLHKFSNKWTTFLKAKLNCSVPGEYPFYFDEIQSTSNIINGFYHIINQTSNDKNLFSSNSNLGLEPFSSYDSIPNRPTNSDQSEQLIYGVFTTNDNALVGSAVCVYSLREIERVFRESPFKGQYNGDSNGNWLPIPQSKTPIPRPGQCTKNQTDEKSLHFIKENPLLDEAVQPEFGGPILISSNVNYRYTKIAIDPQIEVITNDVEERQFYDVMFIGTNDGRIIKAINTASSPRMNKIHFSNNKKATFASNNVPVIIEEIHVLKDNLPITDLRVENGGSESKLIVFNKNEIRAIPLFRCNRKANSCSECVALQDPYCAWDTSKQICSGSKSRLWKRKTFVQNIQFGIDARCGALNVEPTTTSFIATNNPEDLDDNVVIQSKTFYSNETFFISLLCGVFASLIIGFFVGLMSTKHLNKMGSHRRPGDDDEHEDICHPYEDPRNFNPIRAHQLLTSHLNLGTNSTNSSQLNFSQNNNYHQYQGINSLHQTYGRNSRPIPPPFSQINMSNNSDAYGSVIGNCNNSLLMNNSSNLLINGTNSNKINLLNSKANTLGKPNSQIKPINTTINNSNPYNTLNSKNEKSSADNKPIQKVKKIYL